MVSREIQGQACKTDRSSQWSTKIAFSVTLYDPEVGPLKSVFNLELFSLPQIPVRLQHVHQFK